MKEKTAKEKLINEYSYRTEMHAHTYTASECSEVRLIFLILYMMASIQLQSTHITMTGSW